MEDNLQILMPVTFTEGCDSYVSLRDFHEFLGIGDSFRIWAEKILNYGFVENEDYKVVYQENSVIPTIADYMITLPMAKEITTIVQNEKGRQAREYFLKVERKFKNAQVALKSLIDFAQSNLMTNTNRKVEENENTLKSTATEESLSEAPKMRRTNFALNNVDTNNQIASNDIDNYSTNNNYVNTNDNYISVNKEVNTSTTTDLKTNFRDTSKLFGIRENLFVNWLILNKYIYRDNRGNLKPYAKVMNYFNMRTYSTTSGHSGIQTLINSEGREAFRNLLINENIIKKDVSY